MHGREAGSGFHAQFVDQQLAGVRVDAQRLGLPAAPVQREHQQLAQSLAQRVLGGERAQLGDDLAVQADVEGRRAAFFPGGDLEFGQPEPLGLGVRARHSGERAAAPQREGGHQQPVCLTLVRDRGGLGDARVEHGQVEGVGGDPQGVPVADRDQQFCGRPGLPVGFDDGAQPGDVRAECGDRLGRRPVAPQAVDEVVGAHRPALAEQERGEDGLLLGGAQGERLLAPPRLDRAENLEAQRGWVRRFPMLHCHPPMAGGGVPVQSTRRSAAASTV